MAFCDSILLGEGFGDWAAARELQERAVEGWRATVGDEHPRTLAVRGRLADTFAAIAHTQSQTAAGAEGAVEAAVEAAEREYEAVIAGCERQRGTDDRVTLHWRSRLAWLKYEDLGECAPPDPPYIISQLPHPTSQPTASRQHPLVVVPSFFV